MQHSRNSAVRRHPRAGFTLVEMLVAVALVLLMMTMFAQVFQIAGGTISTQRGIAENDQRARSLQNILKADLDKRTFRLVQPWAVGEDGTLPECEAIRRQGYLYISENDPNRDDDDVLQFTINVFNTNKNPDTTTLYGRATQLPNASLLTHPNQPEADDGWTQANGSAEAPAAEIALFMRNGKLYRRVLLIREPASGATTQPRFADDRDMFDPDATSMSGPQPYGATNPFWRDFDHSAFPFAGGVGGSTVFAHFHGVADLTNVRGQTQFALGDPRWRYGFVTVGSRVGTPREFDGSSTFFGRFTHEETSNLNFRYPQGLANIGGSPGNPLTASITLDTTSTSNNFGAITEFANGTRRGEDILLSNVHAFDVKVWDAAASGGAGAFVDLGGTGASDYAMSARANQGHGPSTDPTQNRVFDTWYPFLSYVGTPPVGEPRIDLDGDTFNDPPPYRRVRVTPGGGAALWTANNPTTVGALVFPTGANRRANGLRLVYRCVAIVGMGRTSGTEPDVTQWPAQVGGRLQDNEVLWEAIENWVPLRAIQITVRFFDTTSEQMRQVTLVQSLTDE